MENLRHWTDERLLHDRSSPDETFAAFYRRHVVVVLAFYAREGVDVTLAGDLAAETFAAALLGRGRYRAERETARPWLLGIAHRKLALAYRRGSREQRARRRLNLEAVALQRTDADDYESLRNDSSLREDVRKALECLPAKQRLAIERRVIDEHSYSEVAREMNVTEAAVRQNVHRGLAALRTRLKGNR